MNVVMKEPLSNWKPKEIYPTSLIRVKNVSLDKCLDNEFTSTRIMTGNTSGLGRRPSKKKRRQQKNVYQKSATNETLE